jgi:hypothetical protein
MNVAREAIDLTQFSAEDQKILQHYKITQVLNVPKFIEVNGYEPCIGSILCFGEGGSYDFQDAVYGNTYIYNGTLSRPHVPAQGYRFADGRTQ